MNTSIITSKPTYLTKDNAPYNWEVFPERDEFTVNLFRNLSNAIIMDVSPMTSLRPDGHRFTDRIPDCLHYWLPSVIDSWAYLLYNILIIKYNITEIEYAFSTSNSTSTVINDKMKFISKTSIENVS